MDDREAHFLTLLGDVCHATRIALLAVEVELADGRQVRGVAEALSGGDVTKVGDTGYGVLLMVGDQLVRLDAVVAFTVRRDGARLSRARAPLPDPT